MESRIAAFDSVFVHGLQGNRIAKTKKGLLANVPQQVQLGDIVAILYGWHTPFLLR